jgi:transcriptional activator HAC1
LGPTTTRAKDQSTTEVLSLDHLTTDQLANVCNRKRAKTEDEKEQRRVERVLRNRRAAQSSRERKRQEVEALEEQKQQIERSNKDLLMRLAHQEEQILRLQQALETATGSKMHVFGSPSASSPVQELRRAPSPVTLSQELFGSRDPHDSGISTQSISDLQAAVQTVNPASLSPEIRPVADASNVSSSDMTQHPAAMLCDLQCQSEEQRPWMVSTTATTSVIYRTLLTLMVISQASSKILHPLSQIINSMKTMSPLSPTTSNLSMIIRLVTMATTRRSTWTSSSTTTTHTRPSFGLRICLLRRLLACSPNLARPLMDATMVAMRSASEQQLIHDCLSNVDASVRCEDGNSPSVERLMTLLWTIHVIEMEGKTQKTTKLDAATEVRQACDKLDMFRPDHDISFSLGAGVDGLREEHEALGKKSLADWRMAFPKS